MVTVAAATQKFNLTARAIAGYFKHKCDRNFRYETVAQNQRHPNKGIGWNVPPRVRNYSRAGIHLLMKEGDNFEVAHVKALTTAHGEENVLTAGFTAEGKVQDLPYEQLLERLATGAVPRFVAQLAINLNQLPGLPEKFLAYFSLDPAIVKLGEAKPDLIEFIQQENGEYKLRIWDFKASQAAKHEHFIQVAFYSYLLDFALSESGLSGFTVNREEGVIQSRKGEELFALGPYRKALKDFLQNRVPVLLNTKAADAHFHVEDHCAMCEYLDYCRREADAGSDLSRIPYMSSESKRHLRKRGIRSHRNLAELDDANTIQALQQTSHDLSLNLLRYITAAQVLEDGIPRSLETRTMLMPRYEDVRIVLCAEGDAVTGTCFALGLKKYRWDNEAGRLDNDEQVFIAETKGDEAGLLLRFLKVLNRHLEETDRHNRQVYEEALEVARQTKEAADEALAAFKLQYPRLEPARKPAHVPLKAQRDQLEQEQDTAKKQYNAIKSGNDWNAVRKRQRTLHFYVYDSYDLFVLRSLIERQLFNEQHPDRRELLVEISALVKLFPPASVLSDPDTFRTIPGTVVTQVLRKMIALPAFYLYDLKSVSKVYQPEKDGQENGYIFNYKYGFGWEFTNQVAFERIHDYWEKKPFKVDSREYSPEEVYEQIKSTLLSKLRATDSIIRRLKEQFRDALLLRKEIFRLHTSFNPIDFRTLEALKVFTLLESALEELDIRHTHTLSATDRNAKFVCIRGMQYVEGADEEDGSLWFTFSPESKDNKFDVGKFTLVVTHEEEPGMLLGNPQSVDGKLFDSNKFSADPYKVRLEAYDLQANPPRVRLKPSKPDEFRRKVDLSKMCVLDQLYIDINSRKVIDVLHKLNESPQNALHIQGCIDNTNLADWQPVVSDTQPVEARLKEAIAAAGVKSLNAGQWKAFLGVFQEPVTLLWGPPGTGKTHTIVHMLIGYALAARSNNKPIRVLVTAFTHHAINNVLNKVAEMASLYGMSKNDLLVFKLSGDNRPEDLELDDDVEHYSEETMSTHLESSVPCLVIGTTVWGTYKGMAKAGAVIQPWFDVVLVDEASQMKLPDALIAFSASKPHSNVILAGDDMQLPPIIHGTYAEEQEFMLSSVFAFIRHQINQALAFDPTIRARRLFQLSENFRMNEPITAYPRDILYEGNFQSANPSIRIQTVPAIAAESTDLLDFLLHPDRPVVLCWYTPPVSYTVRNPIEAELTALLAARLSRTLVERKTGVPYTPEKFASDGLGVLSPHRAQNSIIRQYLAEQGFDFERTPLLVDTVEKLQGKEREVIVVSYGVADEEYATAEADFLLNRNRFNVAITRALCKVIVFCSEPVLNVVSTDRKVLLESMMLKEFRSYCDTGHQKIAWKPSACDELNLNIQWKGF